MSDLPSFEVSPADARLLTKIAERARSVDVEFNGKQARPLLDWRMDFFAVHANGNPLRLSDLLEADALNFAHDAFGIANYLDRGTGKLTQCFRPRFSQQSPHPFDTAEAA